MYDYKTKNIIVIGAGLTGLSCIEYFLSKGVFPKLMDTRVNPPHEKKIPKEILICFGQLKQEWLLSADLIVLSPGISLQIPQIQQAALKGIEIIGDIELFCRESSVPVIAITGSNGKSTVATLVHQMAVSAGWKTALGGNIGVPVLSLLKEQYQLIILELSSFQLEATFSLNALAATVLNVSEDHMDRYPHGLEQYRAAKLRIYEHAQFCIVNSDDKLTIPLTGRKVKQISFGQTKGDYHLGRIGDKTCLMKLQQKIIDVDQLCIVGKHNYINTLAALALADVAGIPRIASLKALRSFQGLAHRFQTVWQHAGIRWINDSKSTNVGSTLAALESMSESNGTIHLLLGGDGKQADFSPLIPYVAKNNLKLYCYGLDKQRLALLKAGTVEADTLEQILHLLTPNLKNGDIVLLSPACASLDQFRNFEHRGDEFTRLAQELGK